MTTTSKCNHNIESIKVNSEISKLKKVLVHAPDDGIGKVFPLKAQEWLFEDIIDVHLAREEYRIFLRVLYHFLDPAKAKDVKECSINPKDDLFPRSDNVIDIQWLLSDILDDEKVRGYVVSAICCLESISYILFEQLLKLPSRQLANTLITGTLPNGSLILAPLPNLMMTRDIGIVVNDHIIISRPAKNARRREAIVMRFVVFNHKIYQKYRNNIIDLTEEDFLRDTDEEVTMEGGDFLMLSDNHLAIGISERTSERACKKLTKILFDRNVVEKVTLIKLPNQRFCMHLDTVMTQVNRNTWVVFGPLLNQTMDIDIQQYRKMQNSQVQICKIDNLKLFLKDIVGNGEELKIVLSGDNKFPDAWREQWTDGCNVFAVKEGVIFTYDRNRSTIEAFKNAGMKTLRAIELLNELESGKIKIDDIENTVITLPSAEISRARGGTHCMTQPLLRL